jgi:hypothetical protein
VIVAAIWGIIAAIMYVVGRREMGAVKGVPQTIDTVKKIPDTLK